MSRKKKCRKAKKYRPSVGMAHLAVGNQTIFGNLTLFLHQVRHSEVVFKDARMVIPNTEGTQDFDAYEVLVLYAFFIANMAQQAGKTLDTSALLVMAGLVNLGYDIYDDTLTKCDHLATIGQRLGAVLKLDKIRLALDMAYEQRDAYIGENNCD